MAQDSSLFRIEDGGPHQNLFCPIAKSSMAAKIEPAIGIYQAASQFETLIAIASRCDRIDLHCYAL